MFTKRDYIYMAGCTALLFSGIWLLDKYQVSGYWSWLIAIGYVIVVVTTERLIFGREDKGK